MNARRFRLPMFARWAVLAWVTGGFLLGAPSALMGAGGGTVQGWGNYNTAGRPAGLTNALAVKAAANYTMVLRGDGTIAMWGDNGNGQLNVPNGLTNVVAIDAGYYAAMALTADGNVHVWGGGGNVNQGAMLNPPASATNLIGIATGMGHCLALRADGQVIAWGGDLFGETDVPPGLSNVVLVAAGQDYSLAVTAEGQTVTWGNGFYGPLPSSATNLTAVALSSFGNGLGLRSDGQVVAWGANTYGQATVPDGLSNAVAIAIGDQNCLALRTDGSMVAWGGNGAGQGAVPTNFPTAKAIAAGSQCSVLITDAPLVEQAGSSQALAAGSDLLLTATVSGSTPWGVVWVKDGTPLAGQTSTTLTVLDVQAADAGTYVCLASNGFGSSFSAGIAVSVNNAPPRWNQQPQTQAVLAGQPAWFVADASGSEPLLYQWSHNGAAVPTGTNATLFISAASAADEGSYAVIVSNNYGALTSAVCYLGTSVPLLLTQPSDLRLRTNWVASLDATAVSALPAAFQWYKDGAGIPSLAGGHLPIASAQFSDAGLYWLVVSNQLGSVTSRTASVTVLTNQIVPAEPGVVVEWGSAPYATAAILGLETNAVALSVGTSHTMILRPDGSVGVWGNPQAYDLLTIPPSATNVADVIAGPGYCMALRQDGTVVTWGAAAPFILGPDPGNTSVIGVAAGPYSCLILRTDGTVSQYPTNTYVPPNATNIVSVALTEEYAVAVEANGNVLTWMGSDPPLAPEVTGLGGVVAVSGGENYNNAALRSDGTVAEISYGHPMTGSLVAGVTNAVAVAGGRGFMALLATGDVVSWQTQSTTNPVALHADRIAFNLLHQAALSPAPFFDQHPVSQTVYAGGTGVLSATVRSPTPFALQWYYEGVPLPGATNAALTFPALTPSQTGHYQLVARNAKYTTQSLIALLSVEGPPQFLQVSPDQTVSAGQPVQLQVSYALNPAGSAQWRFDGLPIPGATNSVLLLPQAAEWMSGTYTLTLSNAYAVAVSPPMRLSVSPAAPTILTQPSAPASVPDGTALTLQVVAVGSLPLAYQWFLNGSGLPGQTQSQLQLSAVSAADNGIYQVQVTNALGAALSQPVTVTSTRAAPAPSVTPPNWVVREGKSFQLSAAGWIAGATLQWRFNGTDLPAQTNNMLVVAGVTLGQSGAYTVVASNALGAVESGAAQVRVLRNAGAGLIRSWGSVAGYPTATPAEAVAGGGNHALALLPNGTVQTWGINSYGQLTVPAGLTNAVAIAARGDFCLALRADGTVLGWGRNDSKQATPPSALTNAVAIAAGSDHAVALRMDGSVAAWGNTNYTQVPTNLPPIAALAAAPGYTMALARDGSVWAWGAPTTRTLTNVPASLSNVVALAGGSTSAYALDSSGAITAWPSSPARPADATNLVAISSGLAYAAALRADARLYTWGSDVYGQVSGPKGASNIIAVTAGDVTTLAISGQPAILSAPVTRFVPAGTNLTLSVTTAGPGPLYFQWALNGVSLPGSTNAGLTIAAFAATNAGIYSVAVTNAYGVAGTNVATLLLGTPPQITTQPADQTVYAGSNATFAVQCSGTATLAYQWALNGTNLAGATASSLTLGDLQLTDQGTVVVVVTNAYGSTTSRGAALTVLPLPVPPSRVKLSLAGTNLSLTLGVQPYRTYQLLTSSNLVDWVGAQILTTPSTNLTIAFPISADPAQFYRLQDITH